MNKKQSLERRFYSNENYIHLSLKSGSQYAKANTPWKIVGFFLQ